MKLAYKHTKHILMNLQHSSAMFFKTTTNSTTSCGKDLNNNSYTNLEHKLYLRSLSSVIMAFVQCKNFLLKGNTVWRSYIHQELIEPFKVTFMNNA